MDNLSTNIHLLRELCQALEDPKQVAEQQARSSSLTKDIKTRLNVEPVDLECPICKDAITGSDKRALECHHTYHDHCIKQWLQQHTSCPMCRSEVKAQSSRRRGWFNFFNSSSNRFM